MASLPGQFDVLRGSFRAPINLAGVKVISDYVDNYKEGLPSEVGLLLLMDPRNGVPKAIIDGSHLTDMRTGAVTASAPNIWRARIRAYWAMSALAARPTGTCACSIACSISRKSAFIRGGRKAATHSPRGSPRISASP